MLGGVGLAIVSGAWFGSKLLATDYAPAQWPNILIGFALGLLLPLLAGFSVVSREWAAKWRAPKPLYRNAGLLIAWVLISAVAVTALVYPDPDHIEQLYQRLQGSRAEMPRATELLQAAKVLPRYGANEDIRFVEQAIRFRSLTSPSEDQANDALNFFAVYLRAPDSRKRVWATLLSAVAARDIEQKITLYNPVAEDPLATKWQRWYVHLDIGGIYLVHKKDNQKARYHFERTLQYEKSRGVLEDLAYIEQLDRNWPNAYQRFEEALQFVDAYKKKHNLATLGSQEAGLYANWCNALRSHANSSAGGEATALRTQALEKCRRAIDAYTPYFDAHWNLARVQIDGGQFADADATLRTALNIFQDLSRTSPDTLNRFGYAEYGDRYTVWLLVQSRFKSNRRLQEDPALLEAFRRGVAVGSGDPLDEIGVLLTELEKRDLMVHEIVMPCCK